MAPSTNSVYQPERIDKISRIMPQFSKVARVGDTVLMGLEGDPAFPYGADRPMATITDVSDGMDGTSVKLRLNDGTVKTVNEYSIAPGDVWEYTDEAFANVMDRERKAQDAQMARAEPSLGDAVYRGETEDLRKQVQELRAELAEEKRLARSFHNTYIMTMKELASDVLKLDSVGDCANFCRTFSNEYDKMKARAEESLYRGRQQQYEEEEEDISDDSGDEEEHLGSLTDYF